MTATQNEIADALTCHLASCLGIQGFAYPSVAVDPPAVVVIQGLDNDPIRRDGDGTEVLSFTIVLVQAADDPFEAERRYRDWTDDITDVLDSFDLADLDGVSTPTITRIERTNLILLDGSTQVEAGRIHIDVQRCSC